MIKEHFIKTHGLPVHPIGWGPSGGAMQLYSIAQNYPGILNGIIPFLSFPDLISYLASGSDCKLLDEALQRAKLSWKEEQKAAMSGFAK
jgi:hypothetical protein